MGRPALPPAFPVRGEINPNAGRFGGLIPVTNRNFWSMNGQASGAAGTSSYMSWCNDATNGKGTYRCRHYLAYDATGLRLLYANTAQDPGAAASFGAESFTNAWANTDLGTTLTVQVKLYYPVNGSGREIPVTWGGQPTVSIAEGGVVLSDPVYAPPFLKSVQNYIDIYSYVQATTTTYWPVTKGCFGGDGEGYVTNTNLAVIGSGTAGITNFGGQIFAPLAVLGVTNPRNQVVVGACGDSIITGAKNREKSGVLQSITVTTDDFSFLDYALGISAPTYPLVKFSRSSGLAQAEAALGSSPNSYRFGVRHGMAALCTHVFVLLCTNDLNNGATVAQCQTYLTGVYNWLKLLGCKVIAVTIPPRTTSTDNWATAGNQTPLSTESNRVGVNTWLRNTVLGLQSNYGTPLVDYVWDMCATYEVNSANVLTLNGGRILTDGTAYKYSFDGIHPSFDSNQNLLNNDPALVSILNSLAA